MIDWYQVAFNALWVIGCAVILAATSYSRWLSQIEGVSTRQILKTPVFQLPLTIGMSLVSSGLCLLSQGWLQHITWAIFTAVFAWQTWGLISDSRHTS